jgi:hypothetical protein
MAQQPVRVVGAAQLRRALKRAGADLADMKAANEAVARTVAHAAADRAPRRSGRLASSIRGNRAVSTAVVRAGSARVPYAGPIHWGWHRRNIKANPWISKAAQATEPVWVAEYKSAVDQIIHRIQ